MQRVALAGKMRAADAHGHAIRQRRCQAHTAKPQVKHANRHQIEYHVAHAHADDGHDAQLRRVVQARESHEQLQRHARRVVQLKRHRERAFRSAVAGVEDVHVVADEAAQTLRIGREPAAGNAANNQQARPHGRRDGLVKAALEDGAQLGSALGVGLDARLQTGTHVSRHLDGRVDGSPLDVAHEQLPVVLDVAHKVEHAGDEHR